MCLFIRAAVVCSRIYLRICLPVVRSLCGSHTYSHICSLICAVFVQCLCRVCIQRVCLPCCSKHDAPAPTQLCQRAQQRKRQETTHRPKTNEGPTEYNMKHPEYANAKSKTGISKSEKKITENRKTQSPEQ